MGRKNARARAGGTAPRWTYRAPSRPPGHIDCGCRVGRDGTTLRYCSQHWSQLTSAEKAAMRRPVGGVA